MEPIIAAGIELVEEVMQLIEQAKAAKTEEHAAIVARLQAARAALSDAQDSAHHSFAEEQAADTAALAAASKR